MATEKVTITIPLDGNFQSELQRLSDEGWEVEDNTQPFATYQLVREAPLFGVVIDDASIKVLRNGKLIDG